MAFTFYNVAILTVSDRCWHGVTQDKTGALLKSIVGTDHLADLSCQFRVVAYQIVEDDRQAIIDILSKWCDTQTADVILTAGGTGFTPRDVTPEATAAVIERSVPSIPAVIAAKCYPLSMYSRQIAGIRKQTLIVNLPGSTKGAKECYEIIQPALVHICQQLRDDTRNVREFHGEQQNQNSQGASVDAGESSTSVARPHQCNHHSVSASCVDVTNVAGRSRKSPYPLIEVNEALALVLKHTPSPYDDGSASDVNVDKMLNENIVEVDLAHSLHRCCARDIHAREALPPFPASIKDGYAVIAGDGAGASRVIGANPAGGSGDDITVSSGTCVRINTGAPIPPGADAVVQVEDTRLTHASDDGKLELKIEILVAPKVGQDIRPMGSDIKVGALVLARHQRLSAWDLGMLATCGVVRVPVFRQPRVALLSTGNELVLPDSSTLPPGCIRDANKTGLRALLETNGCNPVHIFDAGIAHDTPSETLQALTNALKNADVVISTGGVSMGDRDVIKQVLIEDLGATIYFAQVRMKPGKPTTFATCRFEGRHKLIFGLPGNPVSALVTAHLYVLPALRKLRGELAYTARHMTCVSTQRINLDARPEYHRAMLTGTDAASGLPIAVSTGNQVSSRLLSFADAQVLLILPAHSEAKQFIEAGDRMDAMVL